MNEDAAVIGAAHVAGFSKGAFAVDAPDGEHDLQDFEEHGAQVKDFIEEAANVEDPVKIKKQQDLRNRTRIEAEKHPEHDF